MTERPIQYFSDEYLKESSACSPTDIARFLEDIRIISAASQPRPESVLISIKVPSPLLSAFKTQCSLLGVKYQTKIKELMRKFLEDPSS